MNKENLPKIATPRSIKIEVEEGKTYNWCACGQSSTQPFCDGSHKGTSFSPIVYTASSTTIVGFCGCKHSKSGPICDGSHKTLDV
jgi:CDGSH-type Zn-finger protein